MQSPWTSITIIVLLILLCTKQPDAAPIVSIIPAQKQESISLKEVVKEQFHHLEFSFSARYNQQVEQYILEYLTLGRRETEKMLGRSSLYFPLFEYYLSKSQLPDELKFIPFIESRLQPYAKSSVGATGLWQFMPATARHYQLKTSDAIDERLDPHRSTQAAIELLAQLYEAFGDWSLALAAYNCGPGRVKKAIRMTDCHNFWDIKHLLPKQTQRYIPAFMAAAFVVEFAELHGIEPRAPKQLPLEHYSIKVHQGLTFAKISAITNLSTDVIRRLNPGYIQQIIPDSQAGRYVILPAQAACMLEDFLLQQTNLASIPVSDVIIHQKNDPDVFNIATSLNPLPAVPEMLPPPPSGV